MRELAHFRGRFAHVVKRNGGGDVFHQVKDVVHRRDELVDFVAIERRDEGLVQQIDGFVRELVRTFFVGLDVLLMDLHLVHVVDQQFEFVTGVNDALCVRIKDFEKFALGGHETSKHENPGK